jgi:peptide/nickel transport system permease protein
MFQFIARRLLIAIPLLLGLLTLNFFLIHAAPGDPTDLFVTPDMDPEVRTLIIKSMGLDRPLHEQYFTYVREVVLEFNLGDSFLKKRPVADVLMDALPNTLQLSFLALCIELVVGIAIGIVAAVKQYSRVDNIIRVVSLTFYSMPSFYLGLLFLFVFAGGIWHVLPASGMVDVVRHESMGLGSKIWDRLTHILLPALTLGLGTAAGMSRYMRGELLEVIRQDYMRTARAKGLKERVVIFKHGVRNALIPIITIIGLSLPVLFSGAVIVENVFAWPGMGRIMVDAAFQRDYPVFLATNLFFGCMVLLGSTVADVLYAAVDPRVRLE